MCSRYRLVKEKLVLTINGREVEVTLHKRCNVAPQQTMPVIIPDLFGHPQAVAMKWGWQPTWSRQLLINAQAETVQTRPAFKKILGQRCLIPADGFYEWTADKSPIMFTRPDATPLCFAGLWLEQPASNQAAPEKRFLILTTSPGETVAPIHNRMPFIVRPEQYGFWFDPDKFPQVLENPQRAGLASRPVDRRLNSVKNEGEELLRPPLPQPTLFDFSS